MKPPPRHWIIYGPGGEGAFANTYREQVEAAIKTLAAEHPTLHKLRRNEPLGEADVAALAATLNRPDLYISEAVLQQVYERPDAHLVDFVRHILGLARLPSREEEIAAAFDAFIAEHPHFTATQIRFLRAMRSLVIRKTQLTREDLQRPPLNRAGDPQRLFSEQELKHILAFANRLAA